MDYDYVFEVLSSEVHERMPAFISEAESEQSLRQVAARWLYVLDYHEKKAIARRLGGNKYAMTTMKLLDILFEKLVDGYS